MTYLMFDSVNPAALPASGFAATAGYVNGRYPSSPGLRQRFPGLPHVTITVFASGDAMCLDVEPGDATPADVPAWLDRQYARGVKLPIVYCNAGAVAAVRQAAGSRPLLVWSANWTYAPHITAGADATQFADKGVNGENVDMTLMSTAFFAAIGGNVQDAASPVQDAPPPPDAPHHKGPGSLVVTGGKGYALVTGQKVIALQDMASVTALNGGGVKTAQLSQRDYDSIFARLA